MTLANVSQWETLARTMPRAYTHGSAPNSMESGTGITPFDASGGGSGSGSSGGGTGIDPNPAHFQLSATDDSGGTQSYKVDYTPRALKVSPCEGYEPCIPEDFDLPAVG